MKLLEGNIKAVIFDMDGVIVDSEGLWKQAEYDVFSSLGVNVTQENSELTKCMTTSEVTKFWYNKYPWKKCSIEHVEQLVISKVIHLIDAGNCVIKGVESFIKLLRREGYKIGLATNSPSSIIPVVLKKTGVAHLFDTTSSAEFEIRGKPDPAIYYSTARKLNVKPENCLAIEDSYSGIIAAKNAGMTVVAFTNGHNEVSLDIADYKMDSFETCDVEFVSRLNIDL